jgi:hypothetical protein
LENTFFYTFSTIAQTLAGAIALLAGFVLYRLQLLNTEVSNIGEYLASWTDTILNKVNEMPAKSLFSRGQYSELLALANQTSIPEGHYPAKIERERLGALLDYKPSFFRRFYTALFLTAGLITISILALVNTSCLVTSCWASWVLAGAMVWFVVCIFSYLLLLLKVFEEKHPLKRAVSASKL